MVGIPQVLSWVLPVLNPQTTSSTESKYLFVFGDSYSTTGSWVGGVKPSASNPIGNPGMPGETTSGGINWVGRITTQLNTSLTLTYNFARSGATIDTDIVGTWAQYPLDGQVELFHDYLSEKPDFAPWTAANSVAAVWIGINDLGEPFWDGYRAPVDELVERYFELLQDLYNDGLRKFVLLKVPPFDKSPDVIRQTGLNIANLKADIKAYNDAVDQKLTTFKFLNLGVEAYLFDPTPSFNTVLANPQKYGAPNATCTNKDGISCLWWDSYHPGHYIHRLVAENLVREVSLLSE